MKKRWKTGRMDLKVFVKKYANPSSMPFSGNVGVYLVSPKCPTGFEPPHDNCGEHKPSLLKIGVATSSKGIAHRLKQYYTYWPQGLLVWGILETPSYHLKYHTRMDYARDREKHLKRLIKSTKNNERVQVADPKNGTERLGSEWVRSTPEDAMRDFMEKVKDPRDRLFGCDESKCREVNVTAPTAMTRQQARQQAADAALIEQLRPPSPAKLGNPGLATATTRQTVADARAPNAALHPRKKALQNAQQQAYQIAQQVLLKKQNALYGTELKRYTRYTLLSFVDGGKCVAYILRMLGSGTNSKKDTNPTGLIKRKDILSAMNDAGIKYVVKIRNGSTRNQIDRYVESGVGEMNGATIFDTNTKLTVTRTSKSLTSAFNGGKVFTIVSRTPYYELIVPNSLLLVRRMPRNIAALEDTTGYKRTKTTPRQLPRHTRRVSTGKINDAPHGSRTMRALRRHQPDHRAHANAANRRARIEDGRKYAENDDQ